MPFSPLYFTITPYHADVIFFSRDMPRQRLENMPSHYYFDIRYTYAYDSEMLPYYFLYWATKRMLHSDIYIYSLFRYSLPAASLRFVAQTPMASFAKLPIIVFSLTYSPDDATPLTPACLFCASHTIYFFALRAAARALRVITLFFMPLHYFSPPRCRCRRWARAQRCERAQGARASRSAASACCRSAAPAASCRAECDARGKSAAGARCARRFFSFFSFPPLIFFFFFFKCLLRRYLPVIAAHIWEMKVVFTLFHFSDDIFMNMR